MGSGLVFRIVLVSALVSSFGPAGVAAPPDRYFTVCVIKPLRYPDDRFTVKVLDGSCAIRGAKESCTFEKKTATANPLILTKLSLGSKLCLKSTARISFTPKGAKTPKASAVIPFGAEVVYHSLKHDGKTFNVLEVKWSGGRMAAGYEGVYIGKHFIPGENYRGFGAKGAEIRVFVHSIPADKEKALAHLRKSACPDRK